MKRTKQYLFYLTLSPVACLVAGFIGLLVLNMLFPFPVGRMRDRLAPGSALLLAADGSLISWLVDGEDNRRLPVSLGDVSPWLVEATIAVEDKRFRHHGGVDPVAVIRAVGQNLGAGRRVSGASTITMQTIRLLWPRPRRLRVKLVEAFRAWQLERLLDKNEIMELYLSLAPYGGNVVGAEAAARRYFGKSARHLTLAEACLLAGLPQSPARYDPRRHPEAARRRRDVIIRRFLEEGGITRNQADLALDTEVRIQAIVPAVQAPHFAQYALGTTRASGSASAQIHTTLDPETHTTAARLASEHAVRLAGRGVSGPSAVVLSVRDSSILAYVGNASPPGFPGRMIDGVRTARQPGSLLKPFIFALLAEKGRLAPSTRVYDSPYAWAGYQPRNMDRRWLGGMAAGDALRQSRNSTAVKQLEELGVDSLNSFLHRIGLESGPTDRYGLALALGAKEQNLLNLTNAYAALARYGRWLPVRYHKGDSRAEPYRCLSHEAAWLTISALSPPEDAEQPKVVWKTGTSWNQVDAWAIAMTPEYVVGVWCGRLARGGSDWVVGTDDSLPLALDILEAVSGDERATWEKPRGVEMRQVCAVSGAAPRWTCPERVHAPMLVGAFSQCTLHGVEAAPTGDGAGEPEAGPSHRFAVRIVSPTAGSNYVQMPGGNAVLPLVAEATEAGPLTWFLDGERIGVTGSGAALDWRMQPGTHRMSVTDSRGATATMEFRVLATYGRD